MYERPREKVKVERGSSLMFTRDLSYFASILLTRVKFTCLRTEKLRDSGNPPLSEKLSVCWMGVTLWEVVAHGVSSVSI